MKKPTATQAALKRRVDRWTAKLKVKPKRVRVQYMTRKWGSCSSAGSVTLAADLTTQDDGFQEFVIVHELLHLRIPNHGRLFKALMSAYVPQWRKHEAARRGARDISKAR